MALRSNGIKKSNFTGQSVIPSDTTFDYVSGNSNYKITYANFLTSLGVSGTISQVGKGSDVPVLDDQGSFKGIRNINAGFGIKASIDGNNSVRLATDFSFNETGIPLVDDPAASAVDFRSLVAGAGISVGGSEGIIQVSVTGAPASTKTITVSQKSDLPAPSVGVITLAANTQYLFLDDVDIGTDRLVIGDNTVLSAGSSSLITLTYTGTGDMITGVDANLSIDNMGIVCTTARVFNLSSTTNLEILRLFTLSITCASIGVLDDMRAVFSDSTTYTTTTGGYEILNSIDAVSSFKDIHIAVAGTIWDISTPTNVQSFNIDSSLVVLTDPGAIFIEGDNDNNIGSIATLFNSRFRGAGAILNNVSVDDSKWQFFGNDDVQDTRTDALIFLSALAVTTIATVNTPVLMGGVFTEEISSQMTTTAAGRITYDGVKNSKLPITASFSYDPVSGTNKDITMYIAINGVVDVNSGRQSRRSSGTPGSTTVTWQALLSPGDYVEVWLENNTDSVNIEVHDGTLRIN